MSGAVAFFAFFPLVVILREAFVDGASALRLEAGNPQTQSAWLNSLMLAVMVTGVAVPLGATLAWLMERTDLLRTDRLNRIVSAVLSLPLAVPPYLLAMSWALLGNGRNGLLNRPFSLTWIDLYGLDGVVLVLATASYPFVMLSVRASLSSADPSLEEAARVSGAGPLRILRDVTLPLVTPAIAASAGLVFVFATASFGVPYLLGSVADPPVSFLTTRIFQYTTLGGEDMLRRAAALAIFLLATSLAAQRLATWIASRRSTVQVSGKSSRPSLVKLGTARRPLLVSVGLFFAVFIALPLATIFWTSFQSTFADPFSLSFDHWLSVLGRDETLRAFGLSMGLAAGAGAIAAIVGLLVARLATLGGRPAQLLASLSTAPYAVPGTVLAIGLILAFALEFRLVVFDRLTFALYLPGTIALLLVAYSVKYLAFGVRGARAALEQIHPSLEEAARTSGAGPLRAAKDVLLPLVTPAVAAAFVLVALPALSELTMSVMLFGAGTETAGTLLFELQSYADPPRRQRCRYFGCCDCIGRRLLAPQTSRERTQSMSLKINNLHKRFGDNHVVRGLNLELDDGEIVALLGPSGCGKTTALRMVAGLETPDDGEIVVGGTTVWSPSNDLPPERRNVGMVFQSYAVWPHRSVNENVAYPLQLKKDAAATRKADEALALVQLPGMGARFPDTLSGGQQQRVALARALVAQPTLLLFDEPLSNLDAKLREEMRHEIRQLAQSVGTTSLYVTHDQPEAFAVSDRVAVVLRGVIAQVAPPGELYAKPVSLEIAQFVGRLSTLKGFTRTNERQIELGGTGVPVTSATTDDQAVVGIRPEAVQIAASGIGGSVLRATFLGERTELEVETKFGVIKADVPVVGAPKAGEEVHLQISQGRLLI